MSAEARLAELGFQLPPAPQACGCLSTRFHDRQYLLHIGPFAGQADGSLITGCVGQGCRSGSGFQAAQQAGLTLLSTLQIALGQPGPESNELSNFWGWSIAPPILRSNRQSSTAAAS